MYTELFNMLGMRTAPIEITETDGSRRKMEIPASLDGRADILNMLQIHVNEGRAVEIPLTTLKQRAAIVLDDITTEEPAADIVLKHESGQTVAVWLVSGSLRADERANLGGRLEAATGGKLHTLAIPFCGIGNGWTLEGCENRNRTARDLDAVLPVGKQTVKAEKTPEKPKKATPTARETSRSGYPLTVWEIVKARGAEILPALGIPEAQDKVNGKTSYVCPICGHGAHGDGLAFIPIGKKYFAYGKWHESDGTTLKCYGGGCDFSSGSVIDLVIAMGRKSGADLTGAEALQMCADAIGLDISDGWSAEKEAAAQQWLNERRAARQTSQTGPQASVMASDDKTPTEGTEGRETAENGPQAADYTAYYERCRARLDDPAAVAYITGRGISIETARAAGIGYDPAADPCNYPGAADTDKKKYPEPRLIIPCTPSTYIARALSDKSKLPKPFNKGANVALFPADLIDGDHKTIFVVEGWADALALAEVGAKAISLNSASAAGFFLSEAARSGSSATFILCLDNDAAGGGALKAISDGLKESGRKFITADICSGAKDPAEALKADKAAFIKAVADAIERAEHESGPDILESFFDRIQGEAYRPHETGLSWFDDLLDGGLIPQTLTILMATPGSGKTALCQQLAEKMAEHQNSAIYVNLEMSTEQMLARAVSMKIAERAESAAECMTALQVLQGYKWTDAQRQTVKEILDDYRAKSFPFIRYGVADGDIDKLISYLDETGQKCKTAGRKAPAVILDYLHLITGNRTDAQEVIKQAVAALKMYAMKYETLAIAISAINRTSYNRITLSSARDSSGIEYTGDTIISLDYQKIDEGGKVTNEEMAQLQSDPLRKMRLRVLKSRHCAPGRKRDLYYAAAYNMFYDPKAWSPSFAVDLDDAAPFHQQKHGRR